MSYYERKDFSEIVPEIPAVNFILMADSYKLSHIPTSDGHSLYPPETVGMRSYIEPRNSNEIIVPFGMQMFIKRYMKLRITRKMVKEAKNFAEKHGEPFNPEVWEYIIDEYGGFLPIRINSAPEGFRIPGGNALVTIDCFDEKVFWIVQFIETIIQRAIWYPTTIASNDYKVRKVLEKYLDLSSDPVDPNGETVLDRYPCIAFMYHDFGGRAVTSQESAEIGDAAHCVNFMGSDTMSGINAANFYYNCEMAAYSVAATEHSIQCAWGPERQKEYIKAVLKAHAKPGAIVSIVLDGYDVIRETKLLCSFKDEIIKSGVKKIVFRPDSGDYMKIIPKILKIQEKVFGAKINSKGYKVINNVGVIQGDGIDLEAIEKILKMVTKLGYAAENIVFGSGGAMLQKVCRDDLRFAQKVCAIFTWPQGKADEDLKNGQYFSIVPVFKDPVTDPGKKSKSGALSCFKLDDGSIVTADIRDIPESVRNTGEILMCVYDHIKKDLIYIKDDETLANIRYRVFKD